MVRLCGQIEAQARIADAAAVRTSVEILDAIFEQTRAHLQTALSQDGAA
jgi:hypothetical protein